MEVNLISYTPYGEDVIVLGIKMSRSEEIDTAITEKEKEKMIRDAVIHGYWSVLEHSNYTFLIKDISRVASHQLIRHRIASYTQTSHRFVRPDDYVIPPSAEKREHEKYREIMKNEYEAYTDLLDKGVPEEDARYALPNGVTTNILVTMNARELYNFFALRLCTRAQWEIRRIAWLMFEEVRKVHPNLFRYAGPNCIVHENFIRKKPVTLEQETELISERCVEGVPRTGIWRCIRNGRV